MHTSKIMKIKKGPLTPLSVYNVKKFQSSGELSWTYGFQGPLAQVGTDSPEGPLPVSSGSLCFGAKVSEMGEAEKCPRPIVLPSGSPTSQFGGRELIVQCVPYTAPVFV